MSAFRSIITGTGSHLPEKTLTNAELAKLVDTTDEWIRERTGVTERRICGEGESTATLSTQAAIKALKAANLDAKDVDLILVATVTPEMVTPSTGCFVAHALGLTTTPAVDLGAACSGFVYALTTADAFIRAGVYRNILVIGAETLSRITDWQDRSTCIIFGDGAGAVVLQRTDDKQRGIMSTELHADGSGWELLNCAPGSAVPITADLVAGRQHFLKQRGREVFKFAVQRFEELVRDAMAKCELKAEDVTLIIPHQANQRITDAVMDRLGLPPEKAYMTISRHGNTSGASIPLALDEAVRAGKLKEGDIAIFVGFGAGLTWGSVVIRM